ncbi:M28 family metallopeptidase [Paenisporosarcina indica]|uniref:M28 family metallopeptidase n=1 Tax=Paenisporosarcina indica TaxID=650093 RepID=UPI001FE3920D|nr:M28 family metallopeptidase [Paenisporosarcina indica]
MGVRHIVAIIILLIMAGCSENREVKKDLTPEERIMEDVAFWSSERFEGRLAGSEGNQLAAEEIAKRFRQIGLKGYQDDNYLIPFNYMYVDPDKMKKSLVINLKDGSQKELEYGKDWMEKSSGPNKDLTVPISFENPEGKILITEKQQPPNDQIRVQFVKTNKFRKYLTYSEQHSSFQISEPSYAYFIENEAEIENVHLVYYGSPVPTKINNVIGRMFGDQEQENKQAIVISAHFDHVGKAGDSLFPGSTDNASGVASLLNIAEQLKVISDEITFESDIIFAAFNAEESGLIGSQAFVEEIAARYDSVVNINLDSIGSVGGGKISLIGTENGSSELSEALVEIAESKGLEIAVNLEDFPSLMSDHFSFYTANFPSIMITQEEMPFLHMTEDTIDKIEPKPILSVIEWVTEFAEKNHQKQFTNIELENQGGYNAYMKEWEEQTEGLGFGEYKTYMSNLKDSLDIAYNLEKEWPQHVLEPLRNSLKENGFELTDSTFFYFPIDFDSLKVEDGEKIHQLKEEQIRLSNIQFDAVKSDVNFLVQVFNSELENMPEAVEYVDDWKLMSHQPGEEIFNSAIKTVETNHGIMTVFIQGTFTKEMFESFINSFEVNPLIEHFS